jgi:hypothetical protein
MMCVTNMRHLCHTHLQRISGLLLTMMQPRACMYTMYGLGLTTRSALYTSKGSAKVRRS